MLSVARRNAPSTFRNYRRLRTIELERRTMPAAFVVNAFTDTSSGSGNSGDLRYCLTQANDELNFPGEDTITFDAGVFNTLKSIHIGSSLPIATGLVLVGPTPDVVINGNGGLFRLFSIDVPSASGTPITMSNLTLTGGGATALGSCILNQDESLTLNNCSLLANKGNPAVFLAQSSAILSATDSMFANNESSLGGAAIRAHPAGYAGAVFLTRCSLTGNSSAGNGGAICFNGGGNLIINGCTMASNSAASGAGIALTNAVCTLTNCTLSNNSASANGGAGWLGGINAAVTVNNSTITGNTGTLGGGLYRSSTSSNMILYSTVVSGNVSANDIYSATNTTITGGDNLIGLSNANVAYAGPNQLNVTDPQLSGLWDFGGNNVNRFGNPMSRFPVVGSPVMDMGGNPLALPFDQRNVAPFGRVAGVKADVGAIEGASALPYPSAWTVPTNVIRPGAGPNSVTVTFTDDIGINVSSIAASNISIATADGTILPILSATVSPPGNGSPRTATYTFLAPGGTWDQTDNGAYTIMLNGGQVTDTDPIPHLVNGGLLGVFRCQLGDTYTVNALTDTGAGSGFFGDLRYCLNKSNANAGLADSIVFDSSVFQSGTTLTITSALPTISDSTNIDGPGVANLKILGNNKAGFSLSSNVVVNISNLEISGLSNVSAGGVFSVGGLAIVNATNIRFSNNKSSAGTGGGVFALTSAHAQVGVSDCTFAGNSATGSGADGGVVWGAAGTSFTAVRSTFFGNSANDDGGAIFLTSSDLLLTDCSMRSNKAGAGSSADGGAILLAGSGVFSVRNCTLSGNTAGGSGGAVNLRNALPTAPMTLINATISGNVAMTGGGGGVHLDDANGILLLRNCTICNNAASNNGGGINLRVGGLADIVSSIVAGNSAATGVDIFGPAASTVTVTSSDIGNSSGIAVLNKSGANLIDVDPLLGPLSENGGFSLADGATIQTHALLSGSPAINAGANPLALSFDQRGVGFARAAGAATDIGAFEVQGAASALPVVTGFKIGDGNPQRSMVRQLQVTFSEPVSFPLGIAAAFQLNRLGPGSPTGSVNLGAIQSGNEVTITFISGGPVGIDPNMSLKDGLYQLTIFANNVQGASGALDGNGDGTAGDDYSTPTAGPGRVFRLFGDVDGNGLVDGVDFSAFRSAFGSLSLTFSFDGVGVVDGVDFGHFRSRFGSVIP